MASTSWKAKERIMIPFEVGIYVSDRLAFSITTDHSFFIDLVFSE